MQKNLDFQFLFLTILAIRFLPAAPKTPGKVSLLFFYWVDPIFICTLYRLFFFLFYAITSARIWYFCKKKASNSSCYLKKLGKFFGFIS